MKSIGVEGGWREFTDVERVLQSCMIGIDDSDADRLEKRHRRQQAQCDLEALLQTTEPRTEEAYGLALVLSGAGSGDVSSLRLRPAEVAETPNSSSAPVMASMTRSSSVVAVASVGALAPFVHQFRILRRWA